MSATAVFISYSHDSPDHKDRILDLSNRLRTEGVDCRIDQYEQSPEEGWPRWCERQVERSSFVLVACTETYLRRYKGDEVTRKGLGASWEGHIITQELYNAQGRNIKFIPIVFHEVDLQFIPLVLQGATSYRLSEDYGLLYRRLTSQPLIEKPEVGSLVEMPAIQLRSLPLLQRQPDEQQPDTRASKYDRGDPLANTSDAGHAEVRASFAALLRIQDRGRYLLINTPLRPEEFSPFGGGYKYFREAKRILDGLEFRPQVVGPIMQNDLRGFLPFEFLPRLRDWFGENWGREGYAECLRRELTEECLEIGISLLPDFESLHFEHVRTVQEGPYSVPALGYSQYRNFGVYDLDLGHSEGAAVLDAVREQTKRNSNLLWATAEEIIRGRAAGRQAIGGHAAYLLGSRRFRFDGPVFEVG